MMYVLVVEDDANARNGLLLLLESLGHKTCWSANAIGALKLLETEDIDVVLLDVMLGRHHLSGLDVANIKRTMPRVKDVPTIVISALDADMIRAKVHEQALAGIGAIMTKPVDVQELEAILKAIERGKTQEQTLDSEPKRDTKP